MGLTTRVERLAKVYAQCFSIILIDQAQRTAAAIDQKLIILSKHSQPDPLYAIKWF